MTSAKIIDGLIDILGKSYPEMICYKKFVASDFTRPGFFLALNEMAIEDSNAFLIDVLAEYRIDILLPIDSHGYADPSDMAGVANHIMRIFMGKAYTIDGVVLHIQKVETRDNGIDFYSVYLTIRYNDIRASSEPYDYMANLNLDLSAEE